MSIARLVIIEGKFTACLVAAVLGSSVLVSTARIGARAQNANFELRSTVAFVSTQHDPLTDPLLAAEIYLMDGDGTDVRRITFNADGDGFPSLSRDGKKMVFDSNRLRGDGEPLNTSDLFVMESDGSDQRHLVRGSSGTWSPDSKNVAFHASASGAGLPIKPRTRRRDRRQRHLCAERGRRALQVMRSREISRTMIRRSTTIQTGRPTDRRLPSRATIAGTIQSTR